MVITIFHFNTILFFSIRPLDKRYVRLSFFFCQTIFNMGTHVCFHFTAGPKIIVRTEEVLIVVAVLLLWVGAIALFFNRWGKIRMLEPYQPKFQQQHRSSCPLVEIEAIPALKHPSFSRISMGCSLQMPTGGRMGSISGPSGASMYTCNSARGEF